MFNKSVRFSNQSAEPREEVGFSTIPFKKGEWSGEPIKAVDGNGNQIADAWVYPLGRPYSDGSYRFGELLAKVQVEGSEQEVISLEPNLNSATEPQFVYSPELVNPTNIIQYGLMIDTSNGSMSTNFSTWDVVEDRGMRKVFSSTQRLGDFVAKLRLYIFNNQNLMKWELDLTASNPNTVERTHTLTKVTFGIVGNGRFMNIRNAARRNVRIINAYQTFELIGPEDGVFGDGQKQTWYGEILTASSEPDKNVSQISAANSPLWGVSLDWADADEAFGALGVVPEPPADFLPARGLYTLIDEYSEWLSYLNNRGDVWQDYPLGLTKTPSQTGHQEDFAILKGWDVLWSGAAELVDFYQFLAGEDAKRPGHYLEADGSPVRSADHPLWVSFNGETHFHFGVSRDRLGKTDSSKRSITEGWRSKDWQHWSSNLLFVGALLTGSYQLRDEMNNEAELYLAGFTLPSQLNVTTSKRLTPRAFGRTHLAMFHMNTILNREDIVERAMDRFREVIRDDWLGATRAPVKNWFKFNDARLFENRQDSWAPWNECLGWYGMVALWRETQDPQVQQLMVEWGETLIKYGWRVNPENNLAEVGYAVKWNDDGSAVPDEQLFNTDFWRPSGRGIARWSAGVPTFIKDSDLFGPAIRLKAQEIFDLLEAERLRGYSEERPFDDFGNWTAISPHRLA